MQIDDKISFPNSRTTNTNDTNTGAFASLIIHNCMF